MSVRGGGSEAQRAEVGVGFLGGAAIVSWTSAPAYRLLMSNDTAQAEHDKLQLFHEITNADCHAQMKFSHSSTHKTPLLLLLRYLEMASACQLPTE